MAPFLPLPQCRIILCSNFPVRWAWRCTAHSLQGRMCRCPVAGRLHMAGSFRVASAAESCVARAAPSSDWAGQGCKDPDISPWFRATPTGDSCPRVTGQVSWGLWPCITAQLPLLLHVLSPSKHLTSNSIPLFLENPPYDIWLIV